MSYIIKEFMVQVGRKRVFDALTLEEEIARWWTDDLSIKPEVGTLAEFRFQKWGAGTLQFTITELQRGENVSWVFSHGPAGWSGTSVTWQLLPVSEGTHVIFVHEGLNQIVDGVYEAMRKNWEYFLVSLQAYLETGNGRPDGPPYK